MRFISILYKTFDFILPPRCPGTGYLVDYQGLIDRSFWTQLSFIERPFCERCGLPFAFEMAPNAWCGACLETEPVFSQARAAVVYNDPSRQLLLDFKHGDKLNIALTFIPWLFRAGQDLFPHVDAILPVPLHYRRLWYRRFNQSALLAQKLAYKTNKKYLPDALVRHRSTPSQKGLSKSMRAKNVTSAFSCKRKADINNKRLLLIDDVFTSGATLNACAKTLLQSGAQSVMALTVARVTREDV